MNQDLFSEASIGMRYNNLDRENHRSELEWSKIDRNKKNPIGKERHHQFGWCFFDGETTYCKFKYDISFIYKCTNIENKATNGSIILRMVFIFIKIKFHFNIYKFVFAFILVLIFVFSSL